MAAPRTLASGSSSESVTAAITARVSIGVPATATSGAAAFMPPGWAASSAGRGRAEAMYPRVIADAARTLGSESLSDLMSCCYRLGQGLSVGTGLNNTNTKFAERFG